MKRIWIVIGLITILLMGSFVPAKAVQAGAIRARLEQFPDWQSPPSLPEAQGDLYYPDWLAGKWCVTSTLVDAVAPLAPDLVTPGFESSQKQLGQPATFSVQFVPAKPAMHATNWSSPVSKGLLADQGIQGIVADRIYNGTHLTEALMGKDALKSIQIDAESPNRQVIQFRNGQVLASRISNRAMESDAEREFISSELYQQEFRSPTQIYFNQVENTILYRLEAAPRQIEAAQITAIYLSPQDPDYFKARQRPVALYRYRLHFNPLR